MSATGRNIVGHERHADDFYATPGWCTRAILPHIGWIKPTDGCESVLDPCCGEAAILREVRSAWVAIHGCGVPRLRGFELDAGRAVTASNFANVSQHDALAPGSWGRPALVLTNPPYALAMPFVERALREVALLGEVAMLLRLNWLGSQGRAAFHRAHPSDVYILPRRPSFTPDGKTDATEYAWFVWGPRRGGRWSILDVEGRP